MFVEKNNLRESSALASSLALVSSNDSNPQLAILYQHADGNLKKRGLMVEAWIILTLVLCAYIAAGFQIWQYCVQADPVQHEPVKTVGPAPSGEEIPEP
ncbi:MAG: hypothetical protein H6915_08060 [Novosphingobium sp.]|nr:hypothetical protein [Novosphingobium sp.]MCP5389705.1 hypothetical protein [Novosphingobium sp.]